MRPQPPTTHNQHPATVLCSRGFIAALAILLVNDVVLKPVFHNVVSGKLSDIAGLYAFPMLFFALLPAYKKHVYVATTVLFIFWKSSFSCGLLLLLHRLHIPFTRVVDYSDLWALLVLPVSFVHCNVQRYVSPRPVFTMVMAVASLFIFCNDSLPVHRSLKPYPQHYYRGRGFRTNLSSQQVKARLISMGSVVITDSFLSYYTYSTDSTPSVTEKKMRYYWRVKNFSCGTDTIRNLNLQYVTTNRDNPEHIVYVWGYDIDSLQRNADIPAYRRQSRKYHALIKKHLKEILKTEE